MYFIPVLHIYEFQTTLRQACLLQLESGLKFLSIVTSQLVKLRHRLSVLVYLFVKLRVI